MTNNQFIALCEMLDPSRAKLRMSLKTQVRSLEVSGSIESGTIPMDRVKANFHGILIDYSDLLELGEIQIIQTHYPRVSVECVPITINF